MQGFYPSDAMKHLLEVYKANVARDEGEGVLSAMRSLNIDIQESVIEGDIEGQNQADVADWYLHVAETRTW